MRHSTRLSLISDYLRRMFASIVPLADCRCWSKTITNCVTWNKFKKFSCEVCGPYVTGSLWLSMYIWVLHGQGLKSRMDTKTDICLNEIGQCSQNIKIVLSSWFTTLRGPMWSLKVNHYNLQFDLLDLEMHLYSDVESCNNNLCDLQLLTRWDNCWSNPTIKIVVELELPTIGSHTIDQQECTIHLNLELVLSLSKRILDIFLVV